MIALIDLLPSTSSPFLFSLGINVWHVIVYLRYVSCLFYNFVCCNVFCYLIALVYFFGNLNEGSWTSMLASHKLVQSCFCCAVTHSVKRLVPIPNLCPLTCGKELVEGYGRYNLVFCSTSRGGTPHLVAIMCRVSKYSSGPSGRPLHTLHHV